VSTAEAGPISASPVESVGYERRSQLRLGAFVVGLQLAGKRFRYGTSQAASNVRAVVLGMKEEEAISHPETDLSAGLARKIRKQTSA